MLVRLLDGTDHDAARVIPWLRHYGDLPIMPDAIAQAAADLADTVTDTARPGADLLALVDGIWHPGRAHLTQPRPAHRPRRDPGAARVVKSYRVRPDTAEKIEAESKKTGESQGQIIDRLAGHLSS